MVRQHMGHRQPRKAALKMPAPPSQLSSIVARTRHLLLDFDGPLCAVFAGTPAPVVAEKVRAALRDAGVPLPGSVVDMADPLEVFRTIAIEMPEAADLAQQQLTRLEVKAVETARPTWGAGELLVAARDTRRTVAIVSNNSGSAVTAYLRQHDLTHFVAVVIGRDDHDPQQMKPSPKRVSQAVSALDATNEDCTLIGDSPSDVLAGHQAGVPVIGFANKPGKVDKLTRSGADAVTAWLSAVSAALRTYPGAPSLRPPGRKSPRSRDGEAGTHPAWWHNRLGNTDVRVAVFSLGVDVVTCHPCTNVMDGITASFFCRLIRALLPSSSSPTISA